MTKISGNQDQASIMLELINGINYNLYSVLPLSKGYKAIVDNIYLEQIAQFSWFAVVGRNEIVYAKSTQIVKGKQVTLQKYIWGLHTLGHFSNDLEQLTFKNKVTLDCRFTNILPLSGRQNVMRYRKKRPSRSQFKGVRELPNGKFSASIYNGEYPISLGTFLTENQAAIIYDEAAKLIFGDASHLNFPASPSEPHSMQFAAIRIKRASERAKRNKKLNT